MIWPFGQLSAWNIMRGHGIKVDWANVVWCKNFIPKHNFLTWRICKGRLPTQSRLCKMEILNMTQCFFCWNNRETLEHLFFYCSFSRGMWEVMLRKLHPYRKWARSFVDELKWIMNTFLGHGTAAIIVQLSFNGTLYHRWRERNQ